MTKRFLAVGGLSAAALAVLFGLWSSPFRAVQAGDAPPNSFAPVVMTETFNQVRARMEAEKPAIMKRQLDLLAERYDLGDHASSEAKMSRGKPLQQGVRARLPEGTNWDQLAGMSPDEIREKNLFPAGNFPLPHPHHAEGGMIFPEFHIKEVQKQEARDLTRFDLSYDIPDLF